MEQLAKGEGEGSWTSCANFSCCHTHGAATHKLSPRTKGRPVEPASEVQVLGMPLSARIVPGTCNSEAKHSGRTLGFILACNRKSREQPRV